MANPDDETPPSETPARNGRGGRRAGAGRKPRGRLTVHQGDRDYARDLIGILMRDSSQSADLSARCALAILRGTACTAKRPPVCGVAQEAQPTQNPSPPTPEPSCPAS